MPEVTRSLSRTSAQVERIVGDRMVRRCRIEDDDVARTFRRHPPQRGIGQVPVGIDECNAAACDDVCGDEVLHKRRFAHAGLPHNVQVTAAVVFRNGNEAVIRSAVHAAEDDLPVLFSRGEDGRSLQLCEEARLQTLTLDAHGLGRRMEEGRNLLVSQQESAPRIGWATGPAARPGHLKRGQTRSCERSEGSLEGPSFVSAKRRSG